MGDNQAQDNGGNRLLTGWKVIADHFGKDERTVRRWAALQNMPVHRPKGAKRGAVFAYQADLDRWLVGRKDVGDLAPALLQKNADGPSAKRRPRYRAGLLALGGLICVGAAVAGLSSRLPSRDGAGSSVRVEAPSPSQAESFYLDGVYHLETRTADGMARAIGLFSQAIAADPNYAKAYVGMADAYNLTSQYTPASASEVYPKAKAAAERALALAPNDAGAYAALAFNAFYGAHDVERATALFHKAVEFDPGNARAHHWYALVAMHDRDFEVALREIAIAQRLDPRAPSILANKGLILFHAGRVEDALDVLEPLAETQSSLLSPHAYLATIYLATGRNADFLREYRTSAALSGRRDATTIEDAAQRGLDRGGREGMLRAMFVQQRRLYADGREPAFKLALTAAMLGDRSAALDYLDQSMTRGEQDILGIRLEPALAGLRDDEHFRTLVAQAGFRRGAARSNNRRLG